MWKRLTWPWIALRTNVPKLNAPSQNFSRHVRSAESYLRETFPRAVIPKSLLKDTLRDSFFITDEAFSTIQGELMSLGIARYARLSGSGQQLSGLWNRFCLAFVSGELRTHISTYLVFIMLTLGIALVRWCTTSEEREPQMRVPFLTTKSRVDVQFTQPIQQVAFPPAATYDDFTGIAARL